MLSVIKQEIAHSDIAQYGYTLTHLDRPYITCYCFEGMRLELKACVYNDE